MRPPTPPSVRLLLFLATLALSLAGPARAQQITSTTPRILRLVKGGPAATVVFRGRGLSAITGIRVLHADGRPDGEVETSFGPLRRGGLRVRIAAGTRARAGRHTLELSVRGTARRGRPSVRRIRAPLRLVFYDPVRFDRVEPESVEIVPGGAARDISVTGRGFGQLSNPRLLLAGRPVRGASAEIRERSSGRGTIRLSVADGTPTGGRYTLVVDAVEGRTEIPVRVGVVRTPAPSLPAAVPVSREPGAALRVPPEAARVRTSSLRMTGLRFPIEVQTTALHMTGLRFPIEVETTPPLRMTGIREEDP